MRKIYIMMFTVFLNVGFYSCTPTKITDAVQTPQACCGDDGTIYPPLPPPPPPGDDITGG